MSFDDLKKLLEEVKDEKVEQKPRVIIVDDDADMREALEMVFGDSYEVITCASGVEGIESVDENTHAVLLDIKMQGKDGFETFEGIKEKCPLVPIIFHSAYQDIKDPYDIINQYRPFGYIKKGDNEVELSDTLASAVKYYKQVLKNESLILKLREENSSLEKQIQDQMSELDDMINKVDVVENKDALTKLSSRNVFLHKLKSQILINKNDGFPFGVVVMDIDNFSDINDNYGTKAGDRVLKKCGELVVEVKKDATITGRIGDDEFAMFVPKLEKDEAESFVSELFKKIRGFKVEVPGESKKLSVTASAGVCIVEDTQETDVDRVISQVDTALKKAKKEGRNRWVTVTYQES